MNITWVGTSSTDMEDTVNWNPQTIPSGTDTAIFDSSITGIATTLSETTDTFTVSAFNFPNLANPFTFNFENKPLIFTGAGITGTNTNPNLSIHNQSNSTYIPYLLQFQSTSSLGSSQTRILNSGTMTGSLSGISQNIINSQLYAQQPFTIENGGTIFAQNSGIDSTVGNGNNSIAYATSSQVLFDQTLSGADSISITIENNGQFSGHNTSNSETIGLINGYQFGVSSDFSMGNNFNCSIQNSGNYSGSGYGNNAIGTINLTQMNLAQTASFGSDATLEISNIGINVSTSSFNPVNIGYLNDNQYFVGKPLSAGDRFSLKVKNSGTDSSIGVGPNQIAMINSNSGVTGNQVLFFQGGNLGNDATITIENEGNYSGSSSSQGSDIGGMNLGQFTLGDSSNIGLYPFTTGNNFTCTISNTGIDSGSSTGGDSIGSVSTNQCGFYSPCTLGNNASITITNHGNYSGSSSSTYIIVGSSGSNQFLAQSTFTAGDYFNFQASNLGENQGSGVGGYYIGALPHGKQVEFDDTLTLGDNASITITNNGINNSSTSSNYIGSLPSLGIQFFVDQTFTAGNNFQINISNHGENNATSSNNYLGFLSNNTGSTYGTQAHFSQDVTLGNNANISITATGICQSDNSTGNIIAVIAGPQLISFGNFAAGDNFNLNASIKGTLDGQGNNNNSVGVKGGFSDSQVSFERTSSLGSNAKITVLNSAKNFDITGTNNQIGYIGGSQLRFQDNFSAKENLYISVSNLSTNSNDINNTLGHVTQSQVVFNENCILSDGATILVKNTGVVDSSQLKFYNGFTLLNGKAFFEVTNEGTIAEYGIMILGTSSGGTTAITLANSSLYIGITGENYTIESLNGDHASVATSSATLIINKDTTSSAEFSGTIQNYLSNASSLIKTGPGTQILSGTNTYTGSTSINQGVLVINGSITSDTNIYSSGTLKGSGSILGNVTNSGIIAPGQSIGTLTVNSYLNENGTYQAEVNGSGESDLIYSLGDATLNGGILEMSSVDDEFQFYKPYNILSSEGTLTGQFSSVLSAGFTTTEVIYGLNGIDIIINPALGAIAKSCNEIGVATNLDAEKNLNASQTKVISAIATLPLKDAQKALESLSGFQYTNLALSIEMSSTRFLRRLYDPLRSQVTACERTLSKDWSVWFETGPNFSNIHGKQAHFSHVFSYEVTAGVHKQFQEDFTLGAAGSYECNFEKDLQAKSSSNTGYVGLYGLYRPSKFYTLVDLSYGYNSDHTSRQIKIKNLHFTANGTPSSNLIAFYSEIGLDFKAKWILFQPFFGLQVESLWRGKVQEKHAEVWNLSINSYHSTPVNSRLGMHISSCKYCDILKASLDLTWNQRLTTNSNYTKGRFTNFGNEFVICGNTLEKASLEYALTLTRCFTESLQVYVQIEGEWWAHANSNGGLAGFKYTW